PENRHSKLHAVPDFGELRKRSCKRARLFLSRVLLRHSRQNRTRCSSEAAPSRCQSSAGGGLTGKVYQNSCKKKISSRQRSSAACEMAEAQYHFCVPCWICRDCSLTLTH